MKLIIEEFIVTSKQQRDMLCDIRFKPKESSSSSPMPLIIFSHGFKGFKDFGCFNLLANELAKHHFVVAKFNYSKNGTTAQSPIEFVDLDAFSENTFSQELEDLDIIVNTLASDIYIQKYPIDPKRICLIGHSMGGGISILQAAADQRIKCLITWSSIFQFGKFWNETMIEQWQKEGIRYEFNSRTKQQMPLKYIIYEDFQLNQERLNIPRALSNLKIPTCAIHGKNDETVPVEVTNQFKIQNQSIDIQLIDGANHTFGMQQPWLEQNLPVHCINLISITIDFLEKNI